MWKLAKINPNRIILSTTQFKYCAWPSSACRWLSCGRRGGEEKEKTTLWNQAFEFYSFPGVVCVPPLNPSFGAQVSVTIMLVNGVRVPEWFQLRDILFTRQLPNFSMRIPHLALDNIRVTSRLLYYSPSTVNDTCLTASDYLLTLWTSLAIILLLLSHTSISND